jgi:hypothetical protein
MNYSLFTPPGNKEQPSVNREENTEEEQLESSEPWAALHRKPSFTSGIDSRP